MPPAGNARAHPAGAAPRRLPSLPRHRPTGVRVRTIPPNWLNCAGIEVGSIAAACSKQVRARSICRSGGDIVARARCAWRHPLASVPRSVGNARSARSNSLQFLAGLARPSSNHSSDRSGYSAWSDPVIRRQRRFCPALEKVLLCFLPAVEINRRGFGCPAFAAYHFYLYVGSHSNAQGYNDNRRAATRGCNHPGHALRGCCL